MKRIAYLIPEFPGQTHTWIWREVQWLRRFGAELRLVSTQPPPARDRARHPFAAAAAETYYLLAQHRGATIALLVDLMAVTMARPIKVARAARTALRLPVTGGRNLRNVLPLLAPACALVRLAAREDLGHVHCHTCARGAVVALLAERIAGLPYSLTINANLEWWGGAMAEKIGGATFAISTMRWVKMQADAEFPPEVASRITYAPVGVDTDEWRPLPGHRSGHSGPLRLVCVGRLHPSKGFDLALRALGRLHDRALAASLKILGNGPERAALERLTGELGLADAVRFHGSVDEATVRRTVGAADVFLLPSHAEPLGVVVMEAMAMGVPVIATNAGGVTEIATHGQDALLVPPHDVTALVEAIDTLAADPELRRRLARAGRRSIRERFDSRAGAALVYAKLYGRQPDRRAGDPTDLQDVDVSSAVPAPL